MANIQFLNGIDLNGNQLIEVVFENLAAQPGTLLSDGRLWYRTDIDVFEVRANGAFRTLYDSSITLNNITIATGDVDLNSNKITNLTTPTAAGDAANKSYVDALFTGLDWKNSVRAATTVAGTLATAFENGDAIDGVTLATGDRILIKNQAAPAENGLYVVAASGAPVRATDADASAEVTGGLTVAVNEGTTNADTVWVLTTNDAVVLGTTGLTFAMMPGVGSYTGGAGLTLTGNDFAVNVDGSSIEINSDTLRVKAAGITNAMLAGSIDLTTKVTGALPVANGGTGATAAEAARTNLGATTMVATNITGDGSATAFNVDHNMNTKDCIVQVYEATTDSLVLIDTVHSTVDRVIINFTIAPANLKVYRVLVVGISS